MELRDIAAFASAYGSPAGGLETYIHRVGTKGCETNARSSQRWLETQRPADDIESYIWKAPTIFSALESGQRNQHNVYTHDAAS